MNSLKLISFKDRIPSPCRRVVSACPERSRRGEATNMALGKNNISTALRKNMTPQEVKLWKVLRNKNINNIKFRRQFRIGKYIVDFCSLTHKIVIEIDGGSPQSERRM
ncbi:DUF559 domain-containing protein [Candidatus Parcubacteria bacterium]|nr:MAG: DUF559 domain-containing protein [Candidatus Parcubacteria bacterium]